MDHVRITRCWKKKSYSQRYMIDETVILRIKRMSLHESTKNQYDESHPIGSLEMSFQKQVVL